MNPNFKIFGTVLADGRIDRSAVEALRVAGLDRPDQGFLAAKRLVDIVTAALALPVFLVFCVVLSALNPVLNRGPLLFRQVRMGKDCKPFTAYKFRTMREMPGKKRGPFDPVEADRITALGRFLRRTRLDEVPQFINVLLGQMSLIGPRPDYWEHAIHYVDSVPGYRERHLVKPGITGLAQVDGGYADCIDTTFRKVRYDLTYIREASWRTEIYVLWRTIVVMLTGFGAR